MENQMNPLLVFNPLLSASMCGFLQYWRLFHLCSSWATALGLDQHNGQFFISSDDGKEKNTDENGLVERSLIVQNYMVSTPVEYQTQSSCFQDLVNICKAASRHKHLFLFSVEFGTQKFVCMNQGLPCYLEQFASSFIFLPLELLHLPISEPKKVGKTVLTQGFSG